VYETDRIPGWSKTPHSSTYVKYITSMWGREIRGYIIMCRSNRRKRILPSFFVLLNDDTKAFEKGRIMKASGSSSAILLGKN